MKVNKYYLAVIALSAFAASSAFSVTFTGIALPNIVNAVTGSSSYIVVDTADDGIDFSANSVGVTFAANSFLTGTDDYVVALNSTTSTIFGSNSGGGANFTLNTNGITDGDSFYIVTFGALTTASVTTTLGTKFNIATDNGWTIPSSNSANLAFPDNFNQVSNFDATALSIPEPSTYAMFAGALALGYVMQDN